ncbi:MAG: hypothetical protein MUC50_07625 [Myxococcota bacterium]|jgi:hypothetical protein|nr:hypothetical protein [Myxococcota bacterium]
MSGPTTQATVNRWHIGQDCAGDDLLFSSFIGSLLGIEEQRTAPENVASKRKVVPKDDTVESQG